MLNIRSKTPYNRIRQVNNRRNMDYLQIFELLFTHVDSWVIKSRRLKIAGDEYIVSLKAEIAKLEALKGKKSQTLYPIERFIALVDARALLYGLAIENACKAYLIHIGNNYVNKTDGRSNVRTDHNVLELVKQTKYLPTDEEALFLDRLSYQVRVTAKYPIAKDLKGFAANPFQTVGFRPDEDSQLTHSIIVNVLREKALIDVFEEVHNALPQSIDEKTK